MTRLADPVTVTIAPVDLHDNRNTRVCPGTKPFLWQHKLIVLVTIFSGLVKSVSSFLLTLSIGEFFVLQYQAEGTKSRLLHFLGIYIEGKSGFFLLFTLLVVLRITFGFLEEYIAVWLGEKFVRNLRETAFSSQMHSDPETFGRKPYGNYLLRYSGDMKSIQQLISKGILGTVKDGLFMLVGVAFIFSIDPLLALLLVIALLSGIAFMRIMARIQQPVLVAGRNQKSLLLSAVTRSFSRFNRIRERNTVEAEITRFMKRSEESYAANLAVQQRTLLLSSLVPLFQFGLIGAILWMAAGNYTAASAGEVLQIVLILLLLQGTFRRLLKTPVVMAKGRISLDKVRALIDG